MNIGCWVMNPIGVKSRGSSIGRLGATPGAPFSAEYWAGWAHTVNNAVLQILPGETLGQTQPFMAAIVCAYIAGADGKLRPEPHVTAALAVRRRGLDTSIHGRWADVRLWDSAPADLVANGSPLLDWSRFDLEQFRRGMDVEFEHGSHDAQTDVTHDDPIVTGKIALAHMKEVPDY